MFAKDEGEVRVLPGDELKLHFNDGLRKWSGVGHVIEKPNNEEVALELRNGSGAPVDQTHGFSIEFVWKSTSFDRMQSAMKVRIAPRLPYVCLNNLVRANRQEANRDTHFLTEVARVVVVSFAEFCGGRDICVWVSLPQASWA